jgi:hypothetical protein
MVAAAIAISAGAASCSSASAQLTKPADAAERLATELGHQLDGNGLAPKLAAAQDVPQPWHAWDASSGRTSLRSLDGTSMNVPMSFWSGTLWSTLHAAPSGDGYCLLVSSGSAPGKPIAWWVKPSGTPKGKLGDAAACAALTSA